MTEKEALNVALSVAIAWLGPTQPGEYREYDYEIDGSRVGALYRAWPSAEKEGPLGAWARCWIDRRSCCVLGAFRAALSR